MTSSKITNNSPYYDDFDESKNYYRILFRPGRAVQARELTQIQTSLQSQIEKFGTHVFQPGSIVLGGSFDLQPDIAVVHVNTTLGVDDIIGKILIGEDTDLKAHVIYGEESSGHTSLFIRYQNSRDGDVVFRDDENLIRQDLDHGNPVIASIASGATGVGAFFKMSESVIFYSGFFINVPEQRLSLSFSEGQPTKQCLYSVNFEYVDAHNDPDLLDNSQGYSNYAAPGADRLSATVELQVAGPEYDLDDEEFLLFALKDGRIVKNNTRTQYARLYDEMAKRTNDESGHYLVHGMDIFTREHLDTGVNEGRFKSENGGDPSLLSIGIENGLAYVKGYEIGKLQTNFVDIPKATSFEQITNQPLFVRSGNYIALVETTGSVDPSIGETVEFYDTAEERKTNFLDYTPAPSGTKIGEAQVKNVLRGGNEIRLYVMNIVMEDTYSTADIKSVAGSNFFADVSPSQQGNIIRDRLEESLLFKVADYTKDISDEYGNSQTSFVACERDTVSISTDGEFTVTASSPRTFPYGYGTLQSLAKQELILSIDAQEDIAQSGTISVSGFTVTGSSTSFATTINPGERLVVGSDEMIVESVESDTSLTIDRDTLTFSGASFVKRFLPGDIIDLNGWGSNAIARTVDATPTSLEVDIQETLSTSVSAYFVYTLSHPNVVEVQKELRPNRLVLFDTGSLGPTRSLDLGVSDAFKIREIRESDSAFTTETDGDDVTNHYRLDAGQRDGVYDHSRLISKSGDIPDNKHILVKFDYFRPNFSAGYGYFSLESYPVDDTVYSDTTIYTHEIPVFRSSKTGGVYDLRNHLDFRPVKVSTITDTDVLGSATVNPSTTQSLETGAQGITIPVPGSSINFDYKYYLFRKDILTLNKDGDFKIVLGKPSTEPKFPQIKDDVMGIAQLVIPPYPSLASTYARKIQKNSSAVSSTQISHKRYTMQDIGSLESRINTLEYYTALSLIENEAVDKEITDENGINRFKNGFFADGFLDHSLGARHNEDYNVSINSEEQYIRPVFEMDDVNFDIKDDSGVASTENVVTLPFTESPLIEQSKATTYRNIEQSVFRYIGRLTIDPPIDTWIDEKTADRTVHTGVDGDDFGGGKKLETEWGSWEQYGKGYNIYSRSFGDRSGVPDPRLLEGSFSNYADAVRSDIKTGDTDRRSLIESLGQDKRSGLKTRTSYRRETENIGNFVIDGSIKPYIRPQKIRVTARGLKANTQYFVFFDNEDMNDYVTPYTVPVDSNMDNATKGTEGGEVKSNENGEVLLYLRLPENEKRFRLGEKEIMVTDSSTNSDYPSSYASGTFIAHGLQVTQTDTTISTGTIVDKTEASGQKSRTKTMGPSCMAYSFYIDAPDSEDGVFLTSVDVFVKSIHPSLGVWFEIREMSPDGGIRRTQVPYSEVWMEPGDPRLNTSSDASLATNVNFPAPVFLYNDTQYAFVIHTEGLNPDTYFFVSRLGEEDLQTGNTVNERKLTGTVFTTNNNLNWDIVPDVDLTCVFYRAEFATGPQTVTFKNHPYEFIKINEQTVDFVTGDDLRSSEKVTLGNKTGAALPAEGDVVVGQTSGVNGTIVSVDGNDVYTDGFGYIDGESFVLEDDSGSALDLTGDITNIEYGKGVLTKKDIEHNRLTLHDSNALFFVGAVLKNENGDTFEIEEFDERTYSVTRFDSSSLELDATSLEFDFRGIRHSDGAWDSYREYDKDNTVALATEKRLYSASNTAESLNIMAILKTESNYVSPVIDKNKINSVLITNIVNNDTTGEEEPEGGNLVNKYISKTVTLADGQDAEDLIVFLTAYRPPDTDIKVWVRARNANDPGELNEMGWFELETDSTGFSSQSNDRDFMEMEFGLPDDKNGGIDGEFEYTSNGVTYTLFQQFDIKIGLLSNSNHIIPKVADLRAIALQL